MLPLRLLRTIPPLRLAASSRPAPSAVRSFLYEETRGGRSCAAHLPRLPTEFQRDRHASAYGGVGLRHFSSREDSNEGGITGRDESSSPQHPNEPTSGQAPETQLTSTATSEAGNGLVEDDQHNPTTSDSDSSHDNYVLKESVHVHPLSQLVLLYFQTDEGYDWLARRGVLHQSSLTFNGDGTFALSFPEPQEAPPGGDELTTGKDQVEVVTLPVTPPPKRQQIWTQYDEAERTHWLYVTVRNKTSRFLLQEYSSSSLSSATNARRRRRGSRATRTSVDDEEDQAARFYTPWRVGIHSYPKPTLADRVEDAVRAAMQEVDQAMMAA